MGGHRFANAPNTRVADTAPLPGWDVCFDLVGTPQCLGPTTDPKRFAELAARPWRAQWREGSPYFDVAVASVALLRQQLLDGDRPDRTELQAKHSPVHLRARASALRRSALGADAVGFAHVADAPDAALL